MPTDQEPNSRPPLYGVEGLPDLPIERKKGGRPCTICNSPHRASIERARVLGTLSYAQQEQRYNIKRDAIARHFDRKHISDQRVKEIMLEAKREKIAEVDAEINEDQTEITGGLHRIVRELDQLLKRAKDNGDDGMALASLRELRQTLMDLAKLYGKLREVSTVEVKILEAPQWVQLRAILGEVFEQHPAAGQAFIAKTRQLQLTMDA